MSILEEIYDSTTKFLATLDAGKTYRTIVEEAIRLVGGKDGSIFLEANGTLYPVYATNPLSYKLKIRKGGGARYEVFKGQEAKILHSNHIRWLEKISPKLTGLHARSIIIVPLSNQGRSIGVLNIISAKDRSFDRKNLEVLKLFGSLASLAIRKSQLYEEMAKSIEDRDLFISLASHELRTPLTTINGYIQLLLSKIAQRKPIENKWIMELGFESQRMKNLIDEFLEINRVRSGKMQFNFKEVSLSEIANHIISAFKFRYSERKLIVRNNLPQNDLIIADADKLYEVFTNILENAHKYSKGDKEISFILKSNAEYFIITIIDKGQGIEEKELPLVFEGFYKGKNNKHEGMGLGLYLAKNLIDAHKGTISISSKLGEGTTVKILLPKLRND